MAHHSYMDDSDTSALAQSPSETPSEESAQPKKDKDEGESQTALLPKSFFMGKKIKPGDQWMIETVHVYDDQVEVKYATDKEGEEYATESAPESPPAPASASGGMMGMEE